MLEGLESFKRTVPARPGMVAVDTLGTAVATVYELSMKIPKSVEFFR